MSGRRFLENIVLKWLAYQLRVATMRQLTTALASQLAVTAPRAKSCLLRLSRSGQLGRKTLPVAIPKLTGPLVAWSPGQSAPDFEAIAWAARKRLAVAVQRREVVMWASDWATRRVGGIGGPLRKPLQVEHDLGVAAIFFARSSSAFNTFDSWLGEDQYARLRRPVRGQKRPDAVLVDKAGHLTLVLDYLSLYPPAHLRSFHHYWADRNTRYEWW